MFNKCQYYGCFGQLLKRIKTNLCSKNPRGGIRHDTPCVRPSAGVAAMPDPR